MANYTLVTSESKPWTFDELVKPILVYGKAFDEQQEKLLDLQSKAGPLSGLTTDKDGNVHIVALQYNNDLSNLAEKFSTEGFRGANMKSAFAAIRDRYNQQIAPIQNAYNRRLEDAKVLHTSPVTMFYNEKADSTPLDKYMNDLSYSALGLRADGALITKQVADTLTNLKTDLHSAYKKGYIDSYHYRYLQHTGFTANDIQKAISGNFDPRNPSDLGAVAIRLVIDNAVAASGVREWNNPEALKTAYYYANMGASAAAGSWKEDIITDEGRKIAAANRAAVKRNQDLLKNLRGPDPTRQVFPLDTRKVGYKNVSDTLKPTHSLLNTYSYGRITTTKDAPLTITMRKGNQTKKVTLTGVKLQIGHTAKGPNGKNNMKLRSAKDFAETNKTITLSNGQTLTLTNPQPLIDFYNKYIDSPIKLANASIGAFSDYKPGSNYLNDMDSIRNGLQQMERASVKNMYRLPLDGKDTQNALRNLLGNISNKQDSGIKEVKGIDSGFHVTGNKSIKLEDIEKQVSAAVKSNTGRISMYITPDSADGIILNITNGSESKDYVIPMSVLNGTSLGQIMLSGDSRTAFNKAVVNSLEFPSDNLLQNEVTSTWSLYMANVMDLLLGNYTTPTWGGSALNQSYESLAKEDAFGDLNKIDLSNLSQEELQLILSQLGE